MTTKIKIITGFVIMMLLVGVMGFIGYSSMQRSSADFLEYRRMARINVFMSDVGIALQTLFLDVNAFVGSADPEVLRKAEAEGQKAAAGLESSLEYVRIEANRETIFSMQKNLNAILGMMPRLREAVTGNTRQYREVVIPGILSMMDELQSMTRQADGVGNAEALSRVSGVWGGLAPAFSTISRFANSRDQKDAEAVKGWLAKSENALGELESVLTTQGGKNTYAKLDGAFKSFSSAFANMEALNAETRDTLKGLLDSQTAMQTVVNAYNADIDSSMIAFGTVTLEANNTTQRSMLLTAVGGLLAGVVIAVFIVVGLIRVLREVSGYAGAVAAGDFAHVIKVREKGEIGNMIAAIHGIPTVLERLISTANMLSVGIRTGKLRERLDTAGFPGEFSKLGLAVNTVSDAYTGVIDAMPVPVMAGDANSILLFHNTAGDAYAGTGHGSGGGKDPLNAPERGADKCFGRMAMERNAPAGGELGITIQGEPKELAVTAMPLHDSNGKVTGYFEILTDLTEIKQKQAVMLQVAKDASTISDRVAAASEELAAQVEQISRGAEIQRDRVVSTASAMAEMTATVIEVARNAGEASEKSADTRQKAHDGAGLVNRVVESVNTVNSVGASLHHNMQELGQQAESIGGVMNVISDIADQTNLLALNAAIEAARAGEAGRGFAVVADEVRKLAEKTMAATQEVGANINAIQQSARTNIDDVGRAVASVSEAAHLADDSGQALQEIVQIASDNSEVVSSIATAAEEQSAASEEINRAIDEINRVVGETTEGMVQSSAAVQDLSRMAQELRQVMEGLR